MVALVVGNDRAIHNFFLNLDLQPQHWQGPFGLATQPSPGFPPGAPITLTKQTNQVLVALVTGDDGETYNFFLDLGR